MTDTPRTALIVVDMQKDFVFGALAVPNAHEIIVPIRRLMARGGYDVIVASQDWHPTNHMSFTPHGGTWPVHCVAGHAGAAFVDSLDDRGIDVIVRKGTDATREQYSAFDGTGLAAMLTARDITHVHVCGLATDFCVAATAQDASRYFATTVLLDHSRAVRPDSIDDTARTMYEHGITLVGALVDAA